MCFPSACPTEAMESYFNQAVFTAYRLGAYVLLHWIDDPAMLAIVFC